MQETAKSSLKDATSASLAREIVKILLEKKGQDVRLYSVAEVTSVTDYYINVTGRSATNVSALADDVVEKISECDRRALRVEGRAGKAWLLVDYGDVIVNIFDKPSREFYNVDRLWSGECEVDISDLRAEVDEKYNLK